MGKIKIKYRPFSFCPFKVSRSANIASEWKHITPSHFTLIAELIVKGTIANPTHALAKIFNVPEEIINSLHPFHQYTIMEQIGKPLQGEPDPRNYLPTLQLKTKTKIQILTGPSDRLSNLTFGEFIYADSYFMAYGISADQDFFEKHMAVLFRPSTIKSQLQTNELQPPSINRIPFNPDQIEENTKIINQLPPETKIAWQYNYILLRQHLESRYEFVFPKVEEELEKTTTTETTAIYQQWMTVYDHFVGDDIIHSEDYFNKNLHEFLRFLNNKIRESYKKT